DVSRGSPRRTSISHGSEPRLDPSDEVVSRGQLNSVDPLVHRKLHETVRRDAPRQPDAQAGAQVDRSSSRVARVLVGVADAVPVAEIDVDLREDLELREERIVDAGV